MKHYLLQAHPLILNDRFEIFQGLNDGISHHPGIILKRWFKFPLEGLWGLEVIGGLRKKLRS